MDWCRRLPLPLAPHTKGPGLAFSTSLNHGGTAPLMPLSGTLAGGFGGFPTSNETSARLPQGLAGRLALKVQAKLDGFASALYERPLGAPMLCLQLCHRTADPSLVVNWLCPA